MAAEPAPSISTHAPGAESPPVDEREAFVQALRETMLATLTAERFRLADDIEGRRAAQIAAVQSRRVSVASRIRELADEDREAIAQWVVDEQIRIERERQGRVQDLERDLVTSLAEHDARIDDEIQTTEAAIAAHRIEVDTYFAALSRESDPVEIARRAGAVPRFPIIETKVHAVVSAPPSIAEPTAPAADESVVGTEPAAPEAEAPVAAEPEAPPPEPVTAEATAEPEAQPVPVMDPIAAKRAEWWAAWKDLHEPPELSEVLDSADQEAQQVDVLEAVTAGRDQFGSGFGLESIPILRPFARLRRDRDTAEGANGET